MKNYINERVTIGHQLGSFCYVAGQIANSYMSQEKFSELSADEFADLYLDTLVVAMCKIEEKAQNEKKENGFFRRK